MELAQNACLIDYADDIASIIIARDLVDAKRIIEQVMRIVTTWIEKHGLSLATEETEIVLLTK